MAHHCIYCGHRCYCNGDTTKAILLHNVKNKNCVSCGCREEEDYLDLEESATDEDFELMDDEEDDLYDEDEEKLKYKNE